jgi:hypothetical protein
MHVVASGKKRTTMQYTGQAQVFNHTLRCHTKQSRSS